MLDVSVIICTHNPRADYLARVLDALRNQTLPLEKWELLIVDNGSRTPVAAAFDLSWHAAGRHVVESKLGLTWARLRGIETASADLIVFVDDDNVLDQTYLAEAIKIKQNWPSLGVWGSGCIRGEFEVEPPEHLRELRSWLALRDLTGPRWSNLVLDDDVTPWGAGICLRKEIAAAYQASCLRSSIKIVGRQGTSLLSADDREMSFVCCSKGLGIGVFSELKMTHLIPQGRISQDYFLGLVEGAYISNFLLEYKWKKTVPQPYYSWKTMLTVAKTFFLCRGLDRQKRFAWMRALGKANKMIKADLHQSTNVIKTTAAALKAPTAIGS